METATVKKWRRKKLLVIGAVALILICGVLFARPLVASVYYNRALASLNSRGDLDAAEANIRRAIDLRSSDRYHRLLSSIIIAKINILLSQTHQPSDMIAKKFQTLFVEAHISAKRATEINDKEYLNWLQLGNVYALAVPFKIEGAYDQAFEAYKQARILDPLNPVIPLRSAELALAEGFITRAKREASEAIKLKSDYLDASLLLIQIEIREGDIPGAIQTTEKALALMPDSPSLTFQLGHLKYRNRNYTEAAVALEKAITLTPDYGNAKYFLGLTYYELGRRSDAIAQFEALKKTNADTAELDVILKNLKAGKNPLLNVQTRP